MAVRAEYIFRINNTYTQDAADTAEIATGQATGTTWGKGYTGFKGKIRQHLRAEQNGRCAFCRCWVSVGTSFSNLEHIVGKTPYPQFEFLSNNLVYCCHRCNFAKKGQNTLTAPIALKSAQIYPTNSGGFLIINPYYDDYEAYVDFIDDIIIVSIPGSTKGSNTISFYDLTRVELAEERAREFKLDIANVNAALLNRLTNPATPVNVLQQINALVAALPNWVV